MDYSSQQDRELSDALRALAVEEGGRRASTQIETRLRAEVRAVAVRRRLRIVASLTAAAVLAIVVAVPAWRASRRSPPAASRFALEPTAEVATAFLPLPYSGVPTTNAQLVRLQVPRAALASFGLAPIETLAVPPSGTVSADVLVGEDGLARAIRFVRAVVENESP
jgi:hypothetical protein